ANRRYKLIAVDNDKVTYTRETRNLSLINGDWKSAAGGQRNVNSFVKQHLTETADKKFINPKGGVRDVKLTLRANNATQTRQLMCSQLDYVIQDVTSGIWGTTITNRANEIVIVCPELPLLANPILHAKNGSFFSSA